MMWIKTRIGSFLNADCISKMYICSDYKSENHTMTAVDYTIRAVVGTDRIVVAYYDDREKAQKVMDTLVTAMCDGFRGVFVIE